MRAQLPSTTILSKIEFLDESFFVLSEICLNPSPREGGATGSAAPAACAERISTTL